MEERNQFQIVRKDARNCFVESLSDAFAIGKAHFVFATYDTTKPVGKRQTNNISIYIAIDEFLNLHRRLVCGELAYLLRGMKNNSIEKKPLYQSLGGTSAEKLAAQNRSRNDGMSLSRTVQLLCAEKADFLFVADIRNMPAATWRDVVAAVLEASPSEVSLTYLYEKIESHKKAQTKWWKEKVRQTLQIYPNYFQRTERGMWRMKSKAA